MPSTPYEFIPALNQQRLIPFYDPLLRYVMRERVFKQRVIALAEALPGRRILDIGCGTGTLTLVIKRAQPDATITVLDVNENILAIARRKANRAEAMNIVWQKGTSSDLPYPDGSFDLVFASMMLHHLTVAQKLETFREVRRALKENGLFWIAVFGAPHNAIMRLVALIAANLEYVKSHFNGLLPQMLESAGLQRVIEIDRFTSHFGPLSIYQAQKYG